MISQAKAAEVLSVLKDAADERECENQLVLLLGYDCFDFIKQLKKNREMILYCTLLASSQSESERQKLREKMRSDPVLSKILRQLDSAGKNDDDDFDAGTSKKLKEEHEDGDDHGAGQVAGQRKVLELDELAFVQGSHFMANKRCQLPDGSFRKHLPASISHNLLSCIKFQSFIFISR